MKIRYPFSITLMALLMTGCSKNDPMKPCPKEQIKLQYDDGSFEQKLAGSEQDQALLVHFTAPCYPAALLEITICLSRTDSFTLAVWNYSTGKIIIEIPDVRGVSDDSTWAVFDMGSLNIKVDNDFWVGIIYTGKPNPPNSKNWYPFVHSDVTQPMGRSFFLPPGGGVQPVSLGGHNLAIRVVVETGGSIAELKTEDLDTDEIFAFVRK